MNDLRMPDVNTVLIVGNLTRDPSFRRTTNGTPVANFWIASNRKFKDNAGQWRESVCYVGVVAWYKLAETCAENLHRGSAVLIEGELQSRSLRSEDGRNRNIVEIKARRIQFLNKKYENIEEDLEDDSNPDETSEADSQNFDDADVHDIHDNDDLPDDVSVENSGESSSGIDEGEASDKASEKTPGPSSGTDETVIPVPDSPPVTEKSREAEAPQQPEEDNPNKGKYDFGYQDYS
ncbi:single-stranded DNA-binding protein [bacterium]|nr:single-stranded DNA-binding protein [bacterium]